MKKKRLEDMVACEKTIVTSDYHGIYLDKRAYAVMLAFATLYKPNNFVINGDLLDFYSISKFDKNSDRLGDMQDEIDQTNYILKHLRDRLGSDVNMYFLEGNHDNRMQKYLWVHPELKSLKALKLENILDLEKNDIKQISADADYWKKDAGHLKIGDVIITHGDSRLNGAKGGKFAGYNTALNFMENTIIGHVHRLSMKEHTAPTKNVIGVECGCLCQIVPGADWQQGFVTFETINNKLHNLELHPIHDYKVNYQGQIIG